jgi:hypothetical protein
VEGVLCRSKFTRCNSWLHQSRGPVSLCSCSHGFTRHNSWLYQSRRLLPNHKAGSRFDSPLLWAGELTLLHQIQYLVLPVGRPSLGMSYLVHWFGITSFLNQLQGSGSSNYRGSGVRWLCTPPDNYATISVHKSTPAMGLLCTPANHAISGVHNSAQRICSCAHHQTIVWQAVCTVVLRG